MWSFVTLGYVFGLSMVQINNLYQGYIFVLCPLICVRTNAWLKKIISPKKTMPWHQPRDDYFGFLVALLLTGVCAFLISGVMCNYQHLVCKQDQLSLRFFETKTCVVDPIFLPQGFRFSGDWSILVTSETDWQIQIRPAQLHLTFIGLITCFISPAVRLAAGTLDRALQIKEDGYLVTIFGRESSLTDVFYCHGMVGVFVMLYLQQIMFRSSYYLDIVMYYIKMLSEDERKQLMLILSL